MSCAVVVCFLLGFRFSGQVKGRRDPRRGKKGSFPEPCSCGWLRSSPLPGLALVLDVARRKIRIIPVGRGTGAPKSHRSTPSSVDVVPENPVVFLASIMLLIPVILHLANGARCAPCRAASKCRCAQTWVRCGEGSHLVCENRCPSIRHTALLVTGQ